MDKKSLNYFVRHDIIANNFDFHSPTKCHFFIYLLVFTVCSELCAERAYTYRGKSYKYISVFGVVVGN